MNEFDAERRRILRKLSYWTYGALAAAVVLAVAGGALVAWLLSRTGLPFVRTWIIVGIALLVVPLAVHLVQGGLRSLRRRNGED